MEIHSQIKQLSEQLFNEIQSIRRHLHQNPELSFKEFKTSAFIKDVLKKNNISFTDGFVETGIVALIQGNNPDKKTVLLRADMDALPIEEKNNVEYVSVKPGIMHACGHDVHTACVLGASIILNKLKNHWDGTVKVMFQPGEEVLPGGASLMIKAGVLEKPKVHCALAQHVFPELECGKVGFKSGMYMASTDELFITVNGKGGHAAMIDSYINPLLIAAELLVEIQQTFMKDAQNQWQKIPTVVAFGKIEGKGATNIIPDSVELAGTLRTFDETHRASIHKKLSEIVGSFSTRYKISSTLNINHGYPFLENNVELTNRCKQKAIEFLGAGNVHDLPIRMTAEDFAFISQQVPSCFYRLGTGNKEKNITSGVHTATFNIDENALKTGVGLMAWLAYCELAENS